METRNRTVLLLLAIAVLFATQSCDYFRKSDFAVLSVTDLQTFVDTYPDSRKRDLAQNDKQRKQLLDTLKQMFSLAQAGEAEGVHKSDRFIRNMSLNTDQVLAGEYDKRNPDVTVSKEEVTAFITSHQKEFDDYLKFITEKKKEAPTAEQLEMIKNQWGEIGFRAEKARQAGIDKDLKIADMLKFLRANLIANLYTESLQEKFKLSDDEKKKYLAEHPEADVDKLKVKAQGLLDRLKKGESFEKLADENNDDGTRGAGGDLQWFGKGRMDPDFEKAAFGLQKGQYTPDLVKTRFGFHIIKLDDRRKAVPPPPPPPPPGAPKAAPSPTPAAPEEEIHARHIYVSTQEAESYESRQIQEKIKRAIEDSTLKYPVKAPEDFQVNVGGLNPNRFPGAAAPK